MIPRGDIPLCCTLNQSPFVLVYILFGRDGRIHGHKPLNYLAPGGDCEVLFSPGLSVCVCVSVCVSVCPANILVFISRLLEEISI